MIRRLIRLGKRLLRISTLLRISSVLTLIGLVLMVWSLAQPTPMPVILAMSLGQVVGILAFLLFGTAILIDQFRTQRAKGLRAAHREAIPGPGVPSYQAPPDAGHAGHASHASPAPDASSAAHREAPP